MLVLWREKGCPRPDGGPIFTKWRCEPFARNSIPAALEGIYLTPLQSCLERTFRNATSISRYQGPRDRRWSSISNGADEAFRVELCRGSLGELFFNLHKLQVQESTRATPRICPKPTRTSREAMGLSIDNIVGGLTKVTHEAFDDAPEWIELPRFSYKYFKNCRAFERDRRSLSGTVRRGNFILSESLTSSEFNQ